MMYKENTRLKELATNMILDADILEDLDDDIAIRVNKYLWEDFWELETRLNAPSGFSEIEELKDMDMFDENEME